MPLFILSRSVAIHVFLTTTKQNAKSLIYFIFVYNFEKHTFNCAQIRQTSSICLVYGVQCAIKKHKKIEKKVSSVERDKVLETSK